MITKRGKKCLAFILAATLTLEPLATQAIYASDVVYESVDSGSALLADESQKVTVQLQNGTAVIPQGADIETAKAAIAKALVVNTDEVDVKKLDWEYECEGKDRTTLQKNTAFGSLEGFTSTTTKKILWNTVTTEYNHPAFLENGEGDFKFRLKGSDEVVTLHRAYKYESSFVLKDAPYEVSMAFNADQSYDFDATARAIYDAVIAETNPAGLTYDDVSMEYNAGTDIIQNWQPLNSTNWTAAFKKFGPGEWSIRIRWDGNKNYKGTQTQVNVTTADNRIATAVVCREGVSFSYNMDTAVMKQSIFDQVIDWDNSTLPAKDTLSADDFTMEYYGVDDVAGVEGVTKQWAPIEGGKVNLLTYLQMGAGEQQIRITYKGNAEYRPSASAETNVTINKAKVKVKVKSANIYAGDAMPQDFVTTNPSDRFDVYTIYAGLTSNVNARYLS